MKNKHWFLISLAYGLVLVSVVLLVLGSLGFQRDGPTVDAVSYVQSVRASIDGGPWEPVTLPHEFRSLPPRTSVVLEAGIRPAADDAVYIKTLYSPANIYFNGRHVFEFGKRANYPSFLADPPMEIHIIETQSGGQPITLRMEFESPVTQDSMTVDPPMVGTTKELIMERSRVLGLPLVFSMFQIVGGVSLVLISLCIQFIDKKGILFCWLGLFSLATGLSAFGANNFSSVIFRDSSMLYLLTYIGMFTFLIPLLRFARTAIGFENPRPLWYMELFFVFSAGLALALQLVGAVACTQSMVLFHYLLPLALGILAALTIREYVRYHSVQARRFIFPMVLLALCAALEFFKIPGPQWFFSVFQTGTLIFLLLVGVMAGLSVKDSISLRNQKRELDFERSLMDIQVKEQQNRSQLLAKHEQLLRQQRHDLRHHLAVLQDLANPANVALGNYLQTLMDQIPTADRRFCENRTVNAVAAHYDALCRHKHIRLEQALVVPECEDGITDSELCVIFGNLLENAVEACEGLPEDRREIHLHSLLQHKLLTITMDNSFSGDVRTEGGRFRSTKRDDFGVGLTSIQTVAARHHGAAEFCPDGEIFHSSVCVTL